MRTFPIWACLLTAGALLAQQGNFVPVTDQMLQKPDPADWLMWRRTLNSWGYSPLDQINRANVAQLRMVWTRGMGPGVQEATSLVYRGILYLPNPSDLVQALNGATGDLIWEYRRKLPDDVGKFLIVPSINRNIAIYGNLIIDTSVDDFVYALDATTGKLAWENRIVDYREDSAQESLVVDTRVRMPTEMEMLSFETSAIAMLVTAPIEGTAVNQFMRAIKGHQEPAGSRWCLSRSLLIRPPGMRCVKVVLWKTFDIFTQGESDIDEAYAKGDYTYPFWPRPIPKFISNQGGITPGDYSYVATLELGKYFFDPKGSVGRYTGKDGPQQSAEEVIWSLPNGLQG